MWFGIESNPGSEMLLKAITGRFVEMISAKDEFPEMQEPGCGKEKLDSFLADAAKAQVKAKEGAETCAVAENPQAYGADGIAGKIEDLQHAKIRRSGNGSHSGCCDGVFLNMQFKQACAG